jgi:hypothetical protein
LPEPNVLVGVGQHMAVTRTLNPAIAAPEGEVMEDAADEFLDEGDEEFPEDREVTLDDFESLTSSRGGRKLAQRKKKINRWAASTGSHTRADSCSASQPKRAP